jgi:transposase
MKRALILISVTCVAVLATSVSAQAATSVDKAAAATCAKERKAIGRKAFTKKYGERRSMQKCIHRTRGRVWAAQRQAEQECAEELAEVGFADFAEDYGSDETGSDAMANCIADATDFILDPGDDSGDEDEEEL